MSERLPEPAGPDIQTELARLVLTELLEKMTDSWSPNGFRIMINLKLKELNGQPDDSRLHIELDA